MIWRRSSACTFVLRRLRLCVLAISLLLREGAGQNARRLFRSFGVAIVAHDVFAWAFSAGCDAVIIGVLMHVFPK